jgi:replicative DNA helicase
VNEHPLPQNLDAEEHVLGAIMLAGTSGPDTSAATLAAIAATGLRPENFYRESHRWIYESALAVAERGAPTDVLVLVEELRRSGHLDRIEGGTDRLRELGGIVPAISNAPHFAGLVVKAAERREQAEAGRALVAAAEIGVLDDALRERLARVIGGERAA